MHMSVTNIYRTKRSRDRLTYTCYTGPKHQIPSMPELYVVLQLLSQTGCKATHQGGFSSPRCTRFNSFPQIPFHYRVSTSTVTAETCKATVTWVQSFCRSKQSEYIYGRASRHVCFHIRLEAQIFGDGEVWALSR